MEKIKIATRGSALALAQSRWVAEKLQQHGYDAELVIIRTQGDIILDKPLHEIGGKGLFTKEVDRAVLEGTADVSVHSFKDMPVENESGLVLGAVPERESCEDVLVLNNEGCINIGCGSLRRQAQLRNADDSYIFESVRGNIHTRLEKMVNHGWGGLVVAEAALRRLDLTEKYQYRKLNILPAAGQGALGLRVREDDCRIKGIIALLNSPADEICVKAEADFLRFLGGGCHLPAGVRTELAGDEISLQAGVFSLSSATAVTAAGNGKIENVESLVEKLVQDILGNGGKEILDTLAL